MSKARPMMTIVISQNEDGDAISDVHVGPHLLECETCRIAVFLAVVRSAWMMMDDLQDGKPVSMLH